MSESPLTTHPQLQQILTESRYIEEQNNLIASGQLPGAHHIELETVLIGNGWYDPTIQYAAYYNYTVNPGNPYGVTFNNSATIEKMYNGLYGAGNCYDQSVMCAELGWNSVCSASDNFCYNEVEYVLDKFLNRNEYDIRELDPDPFPYNFYPAYLNSPKVQQAIGAFVNFSDYSNTVGSLAFGNTGDDDRGQGTVKDCKKLVMQGVYMVQYNGDADYICESKPPHVRDTDADLWSSRQLGRQRSRNLRHRRAGVRERRLREHQHLGRRRARAGQAGGEFRFRARLRGRARGAFLPAPGGAGDVRARDPGLGHCDGDGEGR